jgi:hypothetical protein
MPGDGMGLFGLLALDRLPFEEAIDRQDAPPLAIASRNEGSALTVSVRGASVCETLTCARSTTTVTLQSRT